MKKINNKLTFTTALINLFLTVFFVASILWCYISMQNGYFFFKKMEGWDGLGAAIMFIVMLIVLIPLSLFHLLAFFSAIKTSYYEKAELVKNNIFTNRGKLISYLLPVLGYFIIAVYCIATLFKNGDISILIIVGISLFMIALLLALPLIDIKLANKTVEPIEENESEEEIDYEESEEEN